MAIFIRLQNLPLSAKTGDIRNFFNGLRIPDGGVQILGGDKGDAFIVFMSDEDARLAMRKDGKRIHNCPIQLFLSSRMEMQHEIEKITKGDADLSFLDEIVNCDARNWPRERRKRSLSPLPYRNVNFDKSRPLNEHHRSKSPAEYSKKNYYIILEGMEPSWSFKEVQEILNDYYAPKNNIRIEISDNPKFKTARAFVKLTKKGDFVNILKKSTVFYDGKKIEIKLCSNDIIENYFPSDSDFKNEYVLQNHDLCYLLKGLPFTCKNEDIIAFFSGLEVSNVIIHYGDNGKPMGTGFVSFRNWKDFKQAVSQNGKKMGNRYIEMLPYTAKEMESIDDDYYSVKKHKEYTKSRRLSLEDEAARLDTLSKSREIFSSERSRGFKSLERRDKTYFKPRPKGDIRNKREASYENPVTSNQLYYNVDEGIVKCGCVVQLSNVDPTAEHRDLLNFLRGFKFVEDTVVRKFRSGNIPTPDVRVTFINKNEAERAIRFLDKTFFYGKPVDVFIVPHY